MSEHQIVLLGLNEETYGVDSGQIQLILNCDKISEKEGMPEFLRGFSVYQGREIPVVSMARRLGLDDTVLTKKSKILVAVIEGMQIGFLADRISEIIKLSEEDIEPVPGLLRDFGVKYLKGVGKRGDQLVIILDLEKLLDGHEVGQLKIS